MFVCIPSVRYEHFFRTYIPIFDILIVAVIPFLLLSIANIGIIKYTMRARQRMRHYQKRAHRRHQRLTIMLLSVIVAFIGFTCPSVIFICVNKIIQSKRMKRDQKTDDIDKLVGNVQPSTVRFIVEICEALWCTKHAMNFILYTLSGEDFRREFIKLFTQCFRDRPSIFKVLITRTPRTVEQRLESTLVETPMIANANHEESLNKQSNHSHEKTSIVCTNSGRPE